MRFDSLLADIRLMCPGMPEPWQYRFLTRSLQQFLSDTQVWQEWTQYDYDMLSSTAGQIVVPNAVYDPSGPTDAVSYVRTDRVLKVMWVPTGELLTKTTDDALRNCDPAWQAERAVKPTAWMPWPSGYATVSVVPVLVHPYPAAVEDETAAALRFFVTQTVTELETPEQIYSLDMVLATSGIAAWIFRRYRETILAGVLAKALMVPNVDWSQPQLATRYALAYSEGSIRARSEADAGQTNTHHVVQYGGY